MESVGWAVLAVSILVLMQAIRGVPDPVSE